MKLTIINKKGSLTFTTPNPLCLKHKKYKAKARPRVNCGECWAGYVITELDRWATLNA